MTEQLDAPVLEVQEPAKTKIQRILEAGAPTVMALCCPTPSPAKEIRQIVAPMRQESHTLGSLFEGGAIYKERWICRSCGHTTVYKWQ